MRRLMQAMNTLPQWRCRITGVLLSLFLRNETGCCLSVVIMTHENASFLNLTLAALEMQWFPKKAYEVIVIDNGSRDETGKIVGEIQERGKLEVKYIEAQETSSRPPQEAGLRAARGSIILFLEDRMIVPKDFLVLHLRHHTSDNTVVVGGSHRSVHTHLFASNYLDTTGTLPHSALGPAEIINDADLSDLIIDNEPYFENAFGDFQSAALIKTIPWHRFNLLNTSLPRAWLARFPFDAAYQSSSVAALDLGRRLQQGGARIVRDKQAFALRQINQTATEDYRTLQSSLELLWRKQRQAGEPLGNLLVDDMVVRPIK